MINMSQEKKTFLNVEWWIMTTPTLKRSKYYVTDFGIFAVLSNVVARPPFEPVVEFGCFHL